MPQLERADPGWPPLANHERHGHSSAGAPILKRRSIAHVLITNGLAAGRYSGWSDKH